MRSMTTCVRKRENPGYSGCKPLRVILTHHAAGRVVDRIENQGFGHFELRGLPYVRVLEIWDRQTRRTLHGMLANQGSLLLGELYPTRGEFVAITLLTADQLRVTNSGDSRLIPRSVELYQVH